MSTSRLGIVGWNPYLSANHFSQRTRRQIMITKCGSESSKSRIYYCQRRIVGKFDRRGNDNSHNVRPNANVCTATDDDTDTDTHATVDTSIDDEDNIGGSLTQPVAAEAKDTQWEPKSTQQSTTEDDDGASATRDEA
ncbi:hypothetical protein J1N35_043393 [Gossypium stocksii]|uniref:Uncharacterized protein n=1 Tax=Gossypium stocksii TaxID=47602 RepID=A0A9D3ZEZ0_9ROSI|nr:hypothetical protein J1N35_043393 [Gossypium stocksii]